ncbi:hypothetical protein HWV62_16320 [Athelia sp. TMB]|nr:hypothetical protein HWV62_16320 [Athelia sp. TMB]
MCHGAEQDRARLPCVINGGEHVLHSGNALLVLLFLAVPDESTQQSSSSSRSTKEKSRSLRPPPNTPLEPTPSSFNPFKSTLPAFVESPTTQEDEVEYTFTAYGDLEPAESYAPIPVPPPSNCPTSSLTSSPKRTANGCLQLRAPIRRPNLPTRSTFNGFSANVGYCRLVIGCANSPCPSPVTTSHYPGFLRSPADPSSSSYLSLPKLSSASSSPCPPSPIPLPIPIRSQSYPQARNVTDHHSDSDTEVESDAESSDTCTGSDILDSDDEGSWLKANLPRSVSMRDVLATLEKPQEEEPPLLFMQLNGHPIPMNGWNGY